ncbi:MAG: hypothetical protein ACR2GK_07725 [Gemmatimonadaceae bacterium]
MKAHVLRRDSVSLGILFFAMAIGLGLGSVNRYDPRGVKGLSDSRSYVQMMDGPTRSETEPVRSMRVLVPLLAHPIAEIARGRIGSWNPEFLALLVVNAMFISWAATLMIAIGERITGSRLTGLVAALLYLLTFNVGSLYLHGLVESVEAWALIALTWLMLRGNATLIPVVAFLAALGKETSVPLFLAFLIGWQCASAEWGSRRARVLLVVSVALSQAAALLLAQWVNGDPVMLPWHVGGVGRLGEVFAPKRIATLVNREWLYAFAWLAPLGLARMRSIPFAWRIAGASSGSTALLLSLFAGAAGNVVRPVFNSIAPLLILAAAIYLVERLGTLSRPESPV